MNANRLINMAMRMVMRFGMRWMNQRSKQNPGSEDGPKDRRAFRGKQPGGDAGKRMRALKRMTRF